MIVFMWSPPFLCDSGATRTSTELASVGLLCAEREASASLSVQQHTQRFYKRAVIATQGRESRAGPGWRTLVRATRRGQVARRGHGGGGGSALRRRLRARCFCRVKGSFLARSRNLITSLAITDGSSAARGYVAVPRSLLAQSLNENNKTTPQYLTLRDCDCRHAVVPTHARCAGKMATRDTTPTFKPHLRRPTGRQIVSCARRAALVRPSMHSHSRVFPAFRDGPRARISQSNLARDNPSRLGCATAKKKKKKSHMGRPGVGESHATTDDAHLRTTPTSAPRGDWVALGLGLRW